MKMYRCKATIEIDLAVESPSLADATEQIDGILRHAGEVRIIEGSSRNTINELTGSPSRHTRSRIQVEV
jgi:hypothetical protein